MNVTPKKLPPSKAKVKCTLCSLVFCNKLYFLKNHWGKTHQRSKLDPDKHWIYVDKRTKETVWEKKAAPPMRLRNPFTVAAEGTSKKKRKQIPVKIKLENAVGRKSTEDSKINSRKTEDNLREESQSEGNKILISPKAEPLRSLNIQKPLKTEKTEHDEEVERKNRARIDELEALVKSLEEENVFLKRERSVNSEKEERTIKSLQLIQHQSSTYLTNLRSTLSVAKDLYANQKQEKDSMEKTSKRDWVLRKTMPNGDERRFCEPCMKWYRSPGLKLGSLSWSPFVNGGVSVTKMKEKAVQSHVKTSYLWNEAYREHEGKAHKKAVEMERTQGTISQYVSVTEGDAMKNRLRIAYHTTKRCQSEVSYEHAVLLAKELCVDVGSTQLGRVACAEMRKTFALGIIQKQKLFFVTVDKYTKALKLFSAGADEVTRHNRQFSIETVTAFDDDNLPKCGLLSVTELYGDATAQTLTAIGEEGFNRIFQQKDEDVIATRLVGVCFDGASTYQGEFNGVGENYRKRNKNIKKHRDRMHVEASALKKVLAAEKQYEKITVLITSVRGYIGSSPKRQKLLEKMHQQLHDLQIVEDEVEKIANALAKTRKQGAKIRRIYSEFEKLLKTINEIENEMKTMKQDISCRQILEEQHYITKRLADFIKSQGADDSAESVTETLEAKIAEYNNKIEVLQNKNPKFEALRIKKSVHTYKLLRYFKIRMVNALQLAIRAIIENFQPLVAFFEKECKRKWGRQEAQVKQSVRATSILAALKD